MRVLFIGSVKFSKELLLNLISIKADIVGVITKEKSDFNSDFVDLASICNENEISYRYVKNINDIDNINWMKSLAPDVIFCFGWSYLLKKDVLNLAPMGVVGYHPAELPKNRGRHPLIWALVLGLKKTASTFFFMDEGADTGDILSQETIEIAYKDDANSLYKKVIDTALSQLEVFHEELKTSTYKRLKQDNKQANYWRKRTKQDGIIDFRMSSRTIYNLVRALNKPYPGAHLVYKDQEVKIWKVEEINILEENAEPGKILEVKDDFLVIKAYDNAIKIIEHEFVELPVVGEYL